MAKQPHTWTEQDKTILRIQYNGTRDSINSLAIRFGVTPCAIKAQIHYLGLAKKRCERWTPEDDELLADLITKYEPRTIATKMHRGVSAIIGHIKILHYKRRERDGWYTKQECCNILGVHNHWLDKYIEGKQLVATPRIADTPVYGGNSCWVIKDTDFRDFIISHAMELQGRIVDIFQVVHILTD